jgi:hypothetical protein
MLTAKLMSPVSGMKTARVGKYKLIVEACGKVPDTTPVPG